MIGNLRLTCLSPGMIIRPKLGIIKCDEGDAVIAALNTPTPDAVRQQLIQNLVCGLITDGIWQKLDCLYITAANSGLNSLPNWINPGVHDLTIVNLIAGLFTIDRGWTGNGANGYLRTNYNPTPDAINYALNDGSFGAYIRTNVFEARYDMGSDDAFGRIRLTGRHTNNFYGYMNALALSGVANLDSRGFFIVNRVININEELYKNKTRTAGTRASIAIPNFEIYILCVNGSGVAQAFSTKQIAAAFIGSGMTQTNVDNFTDRIETYMDAIGAGVIP